MKKTLLCVTLLLGAVFQAFAADPMRTSYSYDECSGSLMPYPAPQSVVAWPDTLVPVMINHVGRHGARYPASAAHYRKLLDALDRADSLGSITPTGRKLMAVTRDVITASDGRWGALDSLGTEEQRGIAARMYMRSHQLFTGSHVRAISSYSPRCMMSMYDFTHQLDRLDNKAEFATSTGRANSALLRPFDTDQEYRDFIDEKSWDEPYQAYLAQTCPLTAISRVLGKDYPYDDDDQARALALAEYYVVAGMAAMSMPCDPSAYFTKEEYNALWSCFNLRQYLQRTATTLSAVPAEIAAPLLLDIIDTTDAYIDGKSNINVQLRFGHAETLMPLLSLMHLQGCYYVTNYFDTVAQHWQDFHVVPMAANLQLTLLRHTASGRYYLRVDLNERPVQLIPNNPAVYLPWDQARSYLMHCVPLYLQLD